MADRKQLSEVVMAAARQGDLISANNLLLDQPRLYWVSELKGSVVFEAAAQNKLDDVIETLDSLADDDQPLCWLHSSVHPSNNHVPEQIVVRDRLRVHVDTEEFILRRAVSRSAAISYVLYAANPELGFDDLEKHLYEYWSEDYYHIFSYSRLHKLLAAKFGDLMMKTPAGIVATIQMSRATSIEEFFRNAARDRLNKQLWDRIYAGKSDFQSCPKDLDYHAFAYYAFKRFGIIAAKLLNLPELYQDYQYRFPKPNRITRCGDPKVALCIPGQLRGYREAFSTWSCLREIPKAERFVSTWADVGSRSLEPAHAKRLLSGRLLEAYRDAGKASQHHVNDYIPNLIALFNQQNRVDRKDLCELYETENVVVEYEPTDWGAMQKMYYKHASVITPIEGFDYIIRIRPDKAIHNFTVDAVMCAVHKSMAERSILVDWLPDMHFSVGFACGDQIMMGPADLMRDCSNAYGENRFFNKAGIVAATISDQFRPHSTLATQLIARDVNIGRAPFVETPLLNAPVPSLELIRRALEIDASMGGNSVARSLLHAVEVDIG